MTYSYSFLDDDGDRHEGESDDLMELISEAQSDIAEHSTDAAVRVYDEAGSLRAWVYAADWRLT